MQHASWLFIAVIGVRQTLEKLGGISFKLETKIMNFMSVFSKKYNRVNSSVVNNMQYNLFTIFPLSAPLQILVCFY